MGQLADWLKYAETKAKEIVKIPKALDMSSWGASIDVVSSEIGSIDTSKLDEALSAADKGNFYHLGGMALLMMERDSSVAAHYNTRRNAVLSRDWEIIDTSKEDSEDAKTLRAAVDNSALRTVLSCLADVPLLGFGGAFLEWNPETSTPSKAVPIHPTRFRFDYGGNPAVMIPDEGGKDVETALSTMDAGKVITARASHSTHPARSGLCRPLLWLHIFHRSGIETRALYMEKFGMPFLHGKLTKDQYENETIRKSFIAKLAKAGRMKSLVSMDGTSIAFESHTGAAANANHGEYIASFDAMIAKLILGQTGTSGDATGMSNGGAQTEVRMDIMASDARLISEAMTMQYIRPAALYLGMAEPERFEFQIHVDPPEDIQAKATMIKTLSDAGYKADKAWVAETFGFPLDETEPPAIAPATGIPGGKPEAAAPAEPDAIPEDSPKEKKAVPFSDMPTINLDKLAADSAAGVASRSFDTAEEAAAMFNPIRNAVRRAFDGIDTNAADWQLQAVARLQSLKESLPPALRSMDWSAFETALKEAMNGAAVEVYQ